MERFATAVVAATALTVVWLGGVWWTGYGLGVSLLALAVGVGLLLRGAADHTGLLPGAVGGGLVVVVVLAGRLWIAQRTQQDVCQQAVEVSVAEDAMLLAVAQQVAQERLDAGEPLSLPGGHQLPEGVAVVEFSSREDVPDNIWSLAENHWKAMSEEDREIQTQRRAAMVAHAYNVDVSKGLMRRFGFSGLFWTVAAVSTVFLIGSRAAI